MSLSIFRLHSYSPFENLGDPTSYNNVNTKIVKNMKDIATIHKILMQERNKERPLGL